MIPDQDWFGALFRGAQEVISSKPACSALIWQGLAGTASLYFVFALGALVARKSGRSLMWLASFVSVALWIMSFSYVFTRLGWTSYASFDLIYVQMGLLVCASRGSTFNLAMPLGATALKVHDQ